MLCFCVFWFWDGTKLRISCVDTILAIRQRKVGEDEEGKVALTQYSFQGLGTSTVSREAAGVDVEILPICLQKFCPVYHVLCVLLC